MEGKIKVLIAKLGLDSHWRGAILVAKTLRDAGMEVIYVGNQHTEAIVTTAVQEDVDVVGLSSLSGNHLYLAPKVVESLHSKSEGVLVILGGTIPKGDAANLKEIGIDEVFGPGTPTTDIVNYIKERVRRKK